MTPRHYVHVWKLYQRHRVICVVCGKLREVPWEFDVRELASDHGIRQPGWTGKTDP